MRTLYLPDLTYLNGAFQSGVGVLVDDSGVILQVGSGIDAADAKVVRLSRKALLPGLVNVHSHAFQRLIRGMAESQATSGVDFWSWRGRMYQAAAAVSPDDLFDVARMVFMEMAMSGITTVGEFHYLHNRPDGTPYDDPNLLGKTLWRAAQSVGIRFILLRSAYLRSGYGIERDPGQIRFFETGEDYLRNVEALHRESPDLPLGVAPHSVRAVPLTEIREIAAWARGNGLPIHMHVSEQTAENDMCLSEYGKTPLTLLTEAGILDPDTTVVHATHISDHEVQILSEAKTTVCACPTTERNLGDGILAADKLIDANVPISLGTDSQAQIDLLEDARQLDYHLRLRDRKRAILDQIHDLPISQRLFDCATVNGARSLAIPAGELQAGLMADFIAIDLNDPSIAGTPTDHLLPAIVFGLNRTTITNVFVAGKQVVENGRHTMQEEIVTSYVEVSNRAWAG